MSGQIINLSNDEIISEIALQCGDPFFKDFPKNIYNQASYRAERGIAKDYDILDRKWIYTNTAGTSPITIVPLNFKTAEKVIITIGDVDYEFTERQFDTVIDNIDTTVTYYSIIYNANKYELHYTNASVNDILTLYYTAHIAGEEDYELLDPDGEANLIPVLPNKLYEEVIRRAVRYMAKLGVAQFSGQKAEKYTRILQIHTKKGDENQDRSLYEGRPWIQIQRYRFPS